MDAQDKLERAAAIVAEHYVPDSLNYLINRPWLRNVPDVEAGDVGQVDQLGRETIALTIRYAGRVFSIVESNPVPWGHQQPTSSTLTVSVDNELALKSMMTIQTFGQSTSREVSCSWRSIQAFRPGEWMDTLVELCDTCRRAYARDKARRDEEYLQKRAASVDLGKDE